MDGSEGPQAALCRRLVTHLLQLGAPRVELWDERLTTAQADRLLNLAGVRPARRKKLHDAVAAQIILQAFLDARRAASPPEQPPAE